MIKKDVFRVLPAVLAALFIYTVNAFLDTIDHYYHESEVAKKNPVKGCLHIR